MVTVIVVIMIIATVIIIYIITITIVMMIIVAIILHPAASFQCINRHTWSTFLRGIKTSDGLFGMQNIQPIISAVVTTIVIIIIIINTITYRCRIPFRC